MPKILNIIMFNFNKSSVGTMCKKNKIQKKKKIASQIKGVLSCSIDQPIIVLKMALEPCR